VDILTRQEVLDRVVKSHKEAVANLDPTAVPVYLFLSERFSAAPDIRSDHLFRFIFRSYYRLDRAGLGDDFKDAYFQLLQRHRNGPRPTLRQLCDELGEVKQEKQSLQFSFATKLLATLDQGRPVYDAAVASVFGFRRPDHLKDRPKRLERLLAFYDRLTETSQWLVEERQLAPVHAAFAAKYDQWCQVTPMKKVDFILWATGKVKDPPG
jgi:hypothetical protein